METNNHNHLNSNENNEPIKEDEFWDWRFKQHGWPEEPDPVLIEIASSLKPGKALDLGCANGRNLFWLAKQGWQVTGVDFSAVAIELAEKKAEELSLYAKFVKSDILKDSLPEGPFDFVMLFNMHLPKDGLETVIKKAVNVLNVGGYLLIVGHHLDNLGHHGPPDPERLFTESYPKNIIPDDMKIVKEQKVTRSSGNDIESVEDVAVVILAEKIK